jgi:hypothetical protein
MKHLVLPLSGILLLSLAGWGQITPGQQARASVAAHRHEANSNPERPRHRRRHHRHHRRHNGE